MLDKYTLKLIHVPIRNLAKYVSRFNISANQVTLAGFIIGMMAVIFIVFQYYLVALCLIVINRIADGLDGALSRYMDDETASGAFLDIVFDFIFYQAVVVGFALTSADNVLVSFLLMLSIVGTECSFLAFAIYAEKFNIKNINFPQKGFHYMNGLAEGTETIIFFVLICLFPAYYIPFAFTFMVICVITTITRIYFGYRTLQVRQNKS